MTTLLELPRELRNQIWELVFRNQSVTPESPGDFNREICRPCTAQTTHPTRYELIFSALLTCKQIHEEAHQILHLTFNLYISCSGTLSQVKDIPTPLAAKVKKLTLSLHLDEDNRMEWISVLSRVESIFPNLNHLTVHNHMRPPTSYENLVDSIFLAAPLVTLSNRIQQTLHFDYIYEDVMFASPFVGEIRCSDALDEHELVIRDLFDDGPFKAAAVTRDLNLMTAALLRVARAHEQPWFAKLQRRRLEELTRQSAGPTFQ